MRKSSCLSAVLTAVAFLGAAVLGAAPARADAMQDCLAKKVAAADDKATVHELREACAREIGKPTASAAAQPQLQAQAQSQPLSLTRQRAEDERRTETNPFVLSAYKQNYILPYTYVSQQNPIYSSPAVNEPWLEDHNEAEFQVSLRIPISPRNLFVQGDSLDVGFTMLSFWQVYNSYSAPFRETNYEPEIFYAAPLDFRPLGGYLDVRTGVEHQSNGQSDALSRSWNRFYAQLIFSKDNYQIALRPWYRFNESEKASPQASAGDDNPDITTYMGYFDLTGAVKFKDVEFTGLVRDNLHSTNNYGAIQLGMSFPLFGRVRGYAQYFNGYGESMIDYNHHIERIGIGFLFTDIL